MWCCILVAAAVFGHGLAGNIASATLYPQDTHQNKSTLSGAPPCDALVAVGLRDSVLFPSDNGYEPQIESWFALNSRLRPWCLVLPRNTADVSLVVTTLVKAGSGAGDWHIALRSGGHNIDGNNIANGVTIDLSFMNSSDYNPSTNTASIEPGGRWEHTYASLQDHGVTVAGGRDGDVGVGGFLLGGGISFFSGRLGFGCDSVTNFEVVLANGSVVNANERVNSDLWRALKGGSGNFGIVTRYDLESIPTRDLARDLRFLPSNYSDLVVDTVVDFANHDESLGDDALVSFFTYNYKSHGKTISPDLAIGTIHVNTAGNWSSKTSYNRLEQLPAILNQTTTQNMAEAAAASKVDGGTWAARSTRTFKNDPVILRYSNKLHEEYVEAMKEIIGADNFSTVLFLQPIPSSLGRIGQQRGGNMLGLQNVKDNAVMWTGGVTVYSDEAALSVAKEGLDRMSAQIKSFSESNSGGIDFIYANYADDSQDPLGSYGADNVQHMREVAAKYDPTGVFQTRIPGGFKISRVV
ncbi:hypothetical protein JX266_012537 [Neoarthrinium moseri]|nr:hypothetical protein JX266_012537 [Neoarthrinium moseri]